jgi:chemotaxis protein histidine kinase CheA
VNQKRKSELRINLLFYNQVIIEKMSLTIRASVMKGVESMMSEFGRELLTLAGEKYGFDGANACAELMGSSEVKVLKGKKTAAKRVTKKECKEEPNVPLPFVGVVSEGCKGIKFNHGLHTQCGKSSDDDYCSGCQKQADKNASGKPNYGDIRDRVGVNLLEFRDAKGKQTVPYANVVKKLGLDKEVCMREAAKFNVEIPAEHWVERVAKRGRPSKKSVDVSDTESESSKASKKSVKKASSKDLLDALTAAAEDSEKSSTSSRGRPRLSAEEKEAREAAKAEKAAAREAAKAAKIAEREAAKAEKAAAREAAKAEKAAAREAAKAEKAAAREAAKAEKAAARKAAKEEKAAARKAAKAEKATAKKESKSVSIKAEPVEIPEEFRGCAAPELAMAEASKDTVTTDAPVEETPDAEENEVECEEFVHEGVTYWKAGNTLYDPKTQDEVGVWDAASKKIVDGTESDDELSEEELSDDE